MVIKRFAVSVVVHLSVGATVEVNEIRAWNVWRASFLGWVSRFSIVFQLIPGEMVDKMRNFER
jgi:3-methyladenine DNA glycosylase AlkD